MKCVRVHSSQDTRRDFDVSKIDWDQEQDGDDRAPSSPTPPRLVVSVVNKHPPGPLDQEYPFPQDTEQKQDKVEDKKPPKDSTDEGKQVKTKKAKSKVILVKRKATKEQDDDFIGFHSVGSSSSSSHKKRKQVSFTLVRKKVKRVKV